MVTSVKPRYIALGVVLATILCAGLSSPGGSASSEIVTNSLAGAGGVFVSASPASPKECSVTTPNGSAPPGEAPSGLHHGNGELWVVIAYGGRIVADESMIQPDGSVRVKFPWWRGVSGQLEIVGRRLDASSPRLQAGVPSGYGDIGFQSTAVFFPTEGCWEITGRVGNAELTFIVHVTKPPGVPPSEPPPPSSVVTPRDRLILTSGTGFAISLKTAAGKPVRRMKRGSYRVVVRDRSTTHNAHVTAPGLNRRTGVPFVGKRSWMLRLTTPGTVRFFCDSHRGRGMRGSARVVR